MSALLMTKGSGLSLNDLFTGILLVIHREIRCGVFHYDDNRIDIIDDSTFVSS